MKRSTPSVSSVSSKRPPQSMTRPRFTCDEQLGRLARWLRLLGFDALYQCPIDDTTLVKQAITEGRIVLTRDRHLSAKTLWEKVVLIKATDFDRQIAELCRKIPLDRGSPFTRCLDCNELTQPVTGSEVLGRIPSQILETYSNFYSCPNCRKIFWRGTHVKNSLAKLRTLAKRGGE